MKVFADLGCGAVRRPWQAEAWALLVLLLALTDGMASAAPALPDVLVRPAAQSERAHQRVLLAITRAGERLVSVGVRGIVVLSDDHGVSWRQAKVPVSVSLTNVHFVSGKTGWAVGHSGVVLHSADGGETWVRQLDGVQAAALILEAAKARAQGGGEAAQKELAEAQQAVSDGPDKPFLDLHFFDAQRGLVVGAYGLALSTEDGGKTWQPWTHRIPNPQGKHLYRIHAARGDLLLAGERGALFRSRDGGKTFASISTPYAGSYFGVLSGAPQELLAFGLRGSVYGSRDDGASWLKRDTGSPAALTDGLRLSDGSLLLINQAGEVFSSSDQGATFRRLPLAHSQPASGVVQAADGALVTCGLRGVMRLSLPAKRLE